MDEAQAGFLTLLAEVPELTIVEALHCVGRESHTVRNWRYRDEAFRVAMDGVMTARRRGLTPVAATPPALARRSCGSCGFCRHAVHTVRGDRCLLCLASETRSQLREVA